MLWATAVLLLYAVLGFFIEYKIRNKEVIKELMDKAPEEKTDHASTDDDENS